MTSEAVMGRPDTDAAYTNLFVSGSSVQKNFTSRVIRSQIIDTQDLFIGGVPFENYLSVDKSFQEPVEKSFKFPVDFPLLLPDTEDSNGNLLLVNHSDGTIAMARGIHLQDDELIIKYGLRIGDHPVIPGSVLTADYTGKAYWKPPEPIIHPKQQPVQTKVTVIEKETSVNFPDPLSAQNSQILIAEDGKAIWKDNPSLQSCRILDTKVTAMQKTTQETTHKTDQVSVIVEEHSRLTEELANRLTAIESHEEKLTHDASSIQTVSEQLLKVVQEHESILAGHDEVWKDHSTSLKDHESSLQNHSTSLKDHESSLQDHENSLKDHENSLKDHSTSLQDHSTSLKDHESSLQNHRTSLKDHESSLQDHSTSLQEHEQRLDTHDGRFAELLEQIAECSQNLEERSQNHQTKFAEIQNRQTELDTHQTDIQTKFDNCQIKYAESKVALDVLGQEISSLGSTVETLGSALTSVESTVNTLESGKISCLLYYAVDPQDSTKTKIQSTEICVDSDLKSLTTEILNSHSVITDEISASAGIFSSVTSLDANLGTVKIDKGTAKTLTSSQFSLVSDSASPGKILKCLNEYGEADWSEQVEPFYGPDHSALKSIPRFADNSGKRLTDSAAFLDDTGTLTAQSVFVRSEDCLVHNGQTIVGIDSFQNTLILGTQSQNFAVGEGALGNLEKGTNLIAIGPETLSSCTVGKNCVAIGSYALSSFSGSEAVAIGPNALFSSTGSRGVTAVGFECLYNNRTGHFNTGTGHLALRNALGSANTAHGAGSLGSVVNGEGNSALGTGSGECIIESKGSVCFGDGAGPSGDFSYSISIGQGAHALNQGDLALGSEEAPLKLSQDASSAELPILGPSMYLPVTINGRRYKLALYEV